MEKPYNPFIYVIPFTSLKLRLFKLKLKCDTNTYNKLNQKNKPLK